MDDLSRKEKRRLYLKEHEKRYKLAVKRVKCTLSNEEYNVLLQRARKDGSKPALYLKRASFAYFERRYIVPPNIEADLQRLIVVMRNIGNSLNQIAAKTNKLKRATVFDLRKAKERVDRLEDAIKVFIRNPSTFDPKK